MIAAALAAVASNENACNVSLIEKHCDVGNGSIAFLRFLRGWTFPSCVTCVGVVPAAAAVAAAAGFVGNASQTFPSEPICQSCATSGVNVRTACRTSHQDSTSPMMA